MAKIKAVPGHPGFYEFKCPGCGHLHNIWTAEYAKENRYNCSWTFNGNFDRPTFSPSLLLWTDDFRDESCHIPATRCHTFITDGIIDFLNDCTHSLAGQKVPLPDIV